MQSDIITFAHRATPERIAPLTAAPDRVVANYLPNERPVKPRDYIVTIRTISWYELPDGRTMRRFDRRYLVMTYAFWRKHYYWNPPEGQTPMQSAVCILK